MRYFDLLKKRADIVTPDEYEDWYSKFIKEKKAI